MNRKDAKSAKGLFFGILSLLCVLRAFAFQIHAAAGSIDLICGNSRGPHYSQGTDSDSFSCLPVNYADIDYRVGERRTVCQVGDLLSYS